METEHCGLVVVGAGQAGSELAMAARHGGWSGRIVLLGDEEALPYQRPPLSKAYLCARCDAEALEFRPASAYEAAQVELRRGSRVEAIDCERREVSLADGTCLGYDKLAWCAGGRARPLSCGGLDEGERPVRNLFHLRALADADGMRAQLQPGTRVVVIGGGYIGLEVAASARALGASVTVLEAQPRVLARVAGPVLSQFFEDVHEAEGVTILTGVSVERVEREGDRIVGVALADGRRFDADVVVAGIGMLPNIEPAIAAGIAHPGGIRVDELSRTVDPHIVAAGDCTLQHHPLYDRVLRIESVPNALEQARAAASWLCGKPKPNRSVPWFWSDQYELKLQTAGLSHGFNACVVRGDTGARSFSVFYLAGDRLLAVDAVNRPGDFMQVKRALARPVHVVADALANEAISLKDLLAPAVPAALAGER